MRTQKIRSLFIISKLLLMLASIQFNHQPQLDTGEIGDVSSDSVLAAEAVPGYLLVA